MIKLKLKWLLLLSIFLFVSQVLAENNPQITIFTNARIIDGTGKVIENGSLVIEGDKVKEVTTNKNIAFPNARIINASGKTIIPALIDTHMHLGMLKGTTVKYDNITEQNVRRQLRRYAQYGVGAVLSLGRDPNFIYKLRALRLEKKISGSYLFTAGRGFGVVNGAPPGGGARPGTFDVYRPTSVSQVSLDMNELAAHHPNIVKLWVDDWLGTMPKMKPAMYEVVINEAHKHHLKVAAHIYYLNDSKILVRSGVNVLEHSIRDLPVDAELINLMRQHHVALVPTLTLTEAFFIFNDRPSWMFTSFFKNSLEPGVYKTLLNRTYGVDLSQRSILSLALRNVKKLYDSGIEIGLGTDSGALPTRVQGFGDHRELELLVAAGLTPMQVLKIATYQSAKIIGVDDIMGTLQPNKLANFVVLNANPLERISNTQKIDSVWLDGKLFQAVFP
jgi:imidazolonepropionase-like amidohydrolase